MQYTVKTLSEISGVSVRTLHWYDEIGLLKPAYYQDNGYRCYNEEQLLLLQQILFFRELGFKLNDIQTMLVSSDFDKLKSLQAHKTVLEDNANRMATLVNTIDKTISHLKEHSTMPDNELYNGFNTSEKSSSEQYLVKYHGTVAEDIIFEATKINDLNETQKDEIKNSGNAIYAALEKFMEKGLGTRSDEVQDLIHNHYQMLARIQNASKDVYLAYSQLYCEHPDFKKCFESHPGLAEFIAEAMRFYAHKNLS